MLLQALRKISGALPQLVEQPRVLNGNDGLSGEVRDQGDLLVGEGAHFSTVDRNNSNKLIFLEHWHSDDSANAAKFNSFNYPGMTLGVRFRCRYVR